MKKIEELISVIVCTYNSRLWITKTINSLVNQTYKNLQIIIIDDGSNDDTVKLIKLFQDNRIDIYRKHHSGITNSLNFGLEKAKGNFVAIVDHDDYLHPKRIEEQYRFMMSNLEYGLIGTNFVNVDERGEVLQKIKYPEKHEQIVEQLPRRCCVFHGSMLINKYLFDTVGRYDTSLEVAGDWDLFLKLIGKTKFYNIQKYLMYKRLHKNAASLSITAESEAEKVMLNYSNAIIENSNESKRISDAYFNIGYFYYYQNGIKKSSNYLHRALNKDIMNFQKLRYYISSKFFSKAVLFFRKYKLYKIFDPLRGLDKNNRFFKNK